MAEPLALRYSRTYPTTVERAYDALIVVPLSEIFDQRYLLIPPITTVRDQSGPWEQPGETRTIVLADGGTMHERLTQATRPERFRYEIDAVTGMLKPLVEHVEGEWSFAPAGTGVRVTWTWLVRPSGRVGELAGPVLSRLWRGYARQAFDRLEGVLVGDTQPPGAPSPPGV
jgi:hypothetical protein